MKNQKKYIILGLILIVSAFYFIRVPATDLSQQDFTKLSSIQEMTPGDQYEAIERVYNISFEEGKSELSSIINDFINNNNNLSIVDIQFYEDVLLLRESRNEKKTNNVLIDLVINIDSENIERSSVEDTTYSLDKALYSQINETSYGFYKIDTLTITFLDSKNYRDFTYVHTKSKIHNELISEQSGNEFETRSIVYDLVAGYKNYSLKRFGIVKENAELYIEIPVYDVYGDEERKKTIDNLKEFSDLLNESIVESSVSNEYLSSNEIEKIRIVFNTPWNDEKFVTYTFKLN